MSKVVNLRVARKAKRRAEATVQATANRAAFGRTKGEKAVSAADEARATHALDGARLKP